MNLEDFKANLKFGLARPHSYNVLIQGAYGRIAEDISMMAEEAEIPGKSFATNEMALYGPAIKFPYREVFTDLRITFICSGDMWERIFFDDWQNQVCNPKSGFFAYPDNYVSDIVIQQLNPQGIITYEGKAKRAWPVTIESMPLAYKDTGTYHRVGVSFAYVRFLDTYTEKFLPGDSGVLGSRIPGRGFEGGNLPTPAPPVDQ